MRKRVRAVLALAIIAALLMVPLQAFAAKGRGLAAEASTLTPQTATGQLLAFEVGFQNTGKSTITQFRFDGTVSGGATFHPASTSPCAGVSGGVSCQLGNLPSGAAVQLVLVFNAPSSPGSVTLSGAFTGDANNGTPGAKDDRWAIPNQTASVLQSSSEFFGTYELDTAPKNFQIGSLQSTTVSVPEQAKAYGISVGHSNAAITCGNSVINGFGQTVELTVANGQSAVVVTIRFGAISGLSPAQVEIVHLTDDGCHFPPPDCEDNAGDCFDAYWVGSGSNKRVEVRIEAPHNGSFKGF